MIYDLIVVGNGQAAQTFLFELFRKLDVKKSQNFSVAQIYSEEVATSCSRRSTATASLCGIEEGVSDLGNELREAFFLFENFFNLHAPEGVEKTRQVVGFSNEKDKAKMIRRYKELKTVEHSILNTEMEGTDLNSYVIRPDAYSAWFETQLSSRNITIKNNFIKKLKKNAEGILECELLSGEKICARKIVLCTGAYAKLFSEFFNESFDDSLDPKQTQVVAGSYLERFVDLKQASFYITIDDHNLIYRSSDQQLILGSVSMNNGVVMADHLELSKILTLFAERCNLSLGELRDFKVVTGLRHKGVRRRPIAKALDLEKNIFMINGLYKNGFTTSHLCARKILIELNL
ncbi:MAG: FAD-dependent oxidoreductase [Bacteriovorax sp.]|nr:FAD-dependent oxidoreductase [Bacteriovorax sp.]